MQCALILNLKDRTVLPPLLTLGTGEESIRTVPLMLGLFPLENYYYFSSVSRPVITRVVECLNRIVRLAVVQLQIFECLWRIKYVKLMLDLISLMLRYLYLLDKHQLEVGFNPENSFRK